MELGAYSLQDLELAIASKFTAAQVITLAGKMQSGSTDPYYADSEGFLDGQSFMRRLFILLLLLLLLISVHGGGIGGSLHDGGVRGSGSGGVGGCRCRSLDWPLDADADVDLGLHRRLLPLW
jgi:hypothetical protein